MLPTSGRTDKDKGEDLIVTERCTRIRIGQGGVLEVVDPGLEDLPLLQAIDPGFRVRRARLPGFRIPRFTMARRTGCGLALEDLGEMSEDSLWDAHALVLEGHTDRYGEGSACSVSCGEASLLDLKIELARRILTSCRLCEHRCGVDRTKGEIGPCRLKIEGLVATHYVQIAEEPPINPSLVLDLCGCSLHCRFCQKGYLLDPSSVQAERLDTDLWARLPVREARSLSFIGGNPDESLYAILRFLRAAPKGWRLPVVWNSHGYGSSETLALLDGIVDAYIPDFKFGNSSCAKHLSNAARYPEVAKRSILHMLAQQVPVIVRRLVLPGHLECCHLPVLDFLSSVRGEGALLVSIRGQYCPDWRISDQDGDLARRPTLKEIEWTYKTAKDIGLSLTT